MLQDRLSDLGILSVESEETYTVELELVVEAFSKAKARKCFFDNN